MKTWLFASASLLTLLFSHLAAAEGWGTIKGQFVVEGKIFPPEALAIQRPGPIRAIPNQKLVVGPHGELQNVCLWLTVPRGQSYPQPHPSYAETANDEVEIKLKDYLFQPYLIFIRTSQKAKFKNMDPVGHNIKTSGFANPPGPGIVPKGGQWVQSFTQEERTPCPVMSTVYPWMEAFLLIRESPYAAISDERGDFELTHVPAGTWTFHFWHASAGYIPEIKLLGHVQNHHHGEYEIEVFADEVTDLGKIAISARRFQ
ncbi:hypothetical protein M4951_23005 [Blastopirellula sp. J2-11]|uniref:hypothetical protein n=1 Tax=Blastopirellula sp. J2-11 TaxID=2943192 RepID=UPI0021CA252E|nr:hypothetical protein [Blastopirellula sp. J2-11]UUO06212.1 hypothetical protein M4951_23005 [Blastopirellula sp. J2-11]